MDLTENQIAADFPPGIEVFNFRDWFGVENTALAGTVNLITVSLFVGVGIVIAYFMWAYRNPRIVPTKRQWIAESAYGLIRNSVSVDLLGERAGVRFAPYLASLFFFILATNLWGIVPGVQISPNAYIAFPLVLGVLSWAIYNYVGIRKHGFFGYLKANTIPPGVPIFIWPLMIPIEFFSNLILRPITLALRLFANMFAGHLILVVFVTGGFALLSADNFLLAGMSVFAWIMAIAMTFFEFGIMLLQAYVFVLLTTMYVQGALAEEH